MNWLKNLLYMLVIVILMHTNFGFAGYRHSIRNFSNEPIDVKELIVGYSDQFSRNNVPPVPKGERVVTRDNNFHAWTTPGLYCISGIEIYKAGKREQADQLATWTFSESKGTKAICNINPWSSNSCFGDARPCGNNNWVYYGKDNIKHFNEQGVLS